MCNINPANQGELLAVAMIGLNLIGKLMEDEPRVDKSNVLATATQAYQEGKITKEQYIAVIHALDEKTVSLYQRATVDRDFSSIVKLKSL